MTLHHIEPTLDTVHGFFSAEYPPILTIDSGDTVRFKTLDASGHLEPRTSTRLEEPPKRIQSKVDTEGFGHALCGPVYIRGAKPGMTLAVQIDAIRTGTFGHTTVGGWPAEVNQRLGFDREGTGTFLLWTLDPDSGRAVNQHGHTVEMSPFMGVMGMPPAAEGTFSTIPPRHTGGNIDCKELVVGSTLYLPIEVEGGLFSTGDGHARQGDGESCVTAIECPMEAADLTFHLLPDMHIKAPRAHTPAGWVTFGFHEDLNEATFMALEEMINFMVETRSLSRHEAFGLISVVADLHITQIVNQAKGVHAILPHDALID